MNLIDRQFVVNVSLERAWQHLARVDQWNKWARHIKHIELSPEGELGPQSTDLLLGFCGKAAEIARTIDRRINEASLVSPARLWLISN